VVQQNEFTKTDEDDVPMMSVGPPSVTDPNQVTTKPRKMPTGSGNGMGADSGFGNNGENPADESESGEDQGDEDDASMSAMAKIAEIADRITDENPSLGVHEAIDLARDSLKHNFQVEGRKALGYYTWNPNAHRQTVGPVHPTQIGNILEENVFKHLRNPEVRQHIRNLFTKAPERPDYEGDEWMSNATDQISQHLQNAADDVTGRERARRRMSDSGMAGVRDLLSQPRPQRPAGPPTPGVEPDPEGPPPGPEPENLDEWGHRRQQDAENGDPNDV
jgi:hypothetical protein